MVEKSGKLTMRLVVTIPLINRSRFHRNIQTYGGHHATARSSFQKNSSEVQRELGLDYAFANTLEVDETTGRCSHEEMKRLKSVFHER